MNINDFNTDKLYQALSVDQLKDIANWAGLSACPDMEALKSYLLHKESILDIGCGYGRVLPWLLKHTNANITGIEKADNLYAYASNITNKRLTVIHDSFLKHNFLNKFDCIMMLWTGITDYSKAEANLLFDRIKSIMEKGGLLCLDYIDSMPKNATKSETDEHLYCVTGIGHAKGYAYRPPFNLVKSVLESKGYTYKGKIEYKTQQSDKVMYLFTL